MSDFNSIRVDRRGGTIFIPLPKSAWRSCGTCNCPNCKGSEGFWDTLAVASKESKADYGSSEFTYVVHAPELQVKR